MLFHIKGQNKSIEIKTQIQLSYRGLAVLYISPSEHEDHRDPATFMLGRGEVIQGWEEGLLDMCVGEKRKLSVPASMAYGDTGQRHHKEEGEFILIF